MTLCRLNLALDNYLEHVYNDKHDIVGLKFFLPFWFIKKGPGSCKLVMCTLTMLI